MSSKKTPYAVHWFRRDLRIAGNSAFNAALDAYGGRVLGVFFFDEKFLAREDFSHRRFAFFLKTLSELQEKLRGSGGDLLVLGGGPDEGFAQLFAELRKREEPLPEAVFFNRDYEPFARDRDERIRRRLLKTGIRVETHRDHLLFEPGEVLSGEGEYYQVFSPFARKWFALLNSARFKDRIENASSISKKKPSMQWSELLGGKSELQDRLSEFDKKNEPHVSIRIPDAGEKVAQKALKAFADKIDAYGKQRDYPAIAGTSRLSAYLKNGSLSVPQIIEHLGLSKRRFTDQGGAAVYLKELCWREFYYHVLFRWPEAEKESFREKYRSIQWRNDAKHFEAWKAGRTGYPIVDAGMRELNETGFMHNRVRMIVASFLTKHLLIDWRWGERYFMQQLLDGDLAPNNGGWQWAASTGCDPQPYFRIFNPVLQSKRFDSSGDYIRKYVPELREVNSKQIHMPKEEARPASYAAPIVQHEAARLLALKTYQ